MGYLAHTNHSSPNIICKEKDYSKVILPDTFHRLGRINVLLNEKVDSVIKSCAKDFYQTTKMRLMPYAGTKILEIQRVNSWHRYTCIIMNSWREPYGSVIATRARANFAHTVLKIILLTEI